MAARFVTISLVTKRAYIASGFVTLVTKRAVVTKRAATRPTLVTKVSNTKAEKKKTKASLCENLWRKRTLVRMVSY